MTNDRPLPRWAPDLAIGVGLAAFAFAEAWRMALPYREYVGVVRGGVLPLTDPKFATILVNALVVGWGMALAAGLHRRAPGVALLLVWLAGAYQLALGVEIMLVELAVTIVAFGCSRWGSTAVVWASVLSMPVGAFAAMLFIRGHGFPVGESVASALHEMFWRNGQTAVGAYAFVAMVGGGILAVPWLVGLVLRIRARAGETEAARQVAVQEAEQAQQIAHLQEQQASLARDVHDVVGHSLAVILAQAESAQFRKDTDTEALKQSMRDIATSARASLQDVRQVLDGTSTTTPTGSRGLDSLIDGVRTSGHDVSDQVSGTPQPLPPELDVVAYRVLQEMLTNAIKHGRRGSTLAIERRWEHGLRLTVTNATDQPGQLAGQGVTGMRRRLDAVGGRLDAHRHGDLFTATAWIPVRTT
jgi:signal transduction histidine kinase